MIKYRFEFIVNREPIVLFFLGNPEYGGIPVSGDYSPKTIGELHSIHAKSIETSFRDWVTVNNCKTTKEAEKMAIKKVKEIYINDKVYLTGSYEVLYGLGGE